MKYTGIFIISLVLFGCLVRQSVFAENSMLQAVPISQRLVVPDQNGNRGEYDCMAASFALSLTILADNGLLTYTSELMSYASVRNKARAIQPDYTVGIYPRVLMALTPILTEDSYRLVYTKHSMKDWYSFIRKELNDGRPVIVIVSDRTALYTPHSTENSSHSIVITGLTDTEIVFADSWDGNLHTVSHDVFTQAWGQGDAGWLALSFIKKPSTASFYDVMHISQ